MPEVTTFKLQCPRLTCGAVMDFEADEQTLKELKEEDGAIVECLACKIESEYTLDDFLTAEEFEDEEDDDDLEDLGEVEEIDDEDDEDDED